MIHIDKAHIEIVGSLDECLAETALGAAVVINDIVKQTNTSEIAVITGFTKALMNALALYNKDSEQSSNISIQDLMKQFQEKSKK